MRDHSRFTYRFAAPLPGMVQRITFLALIIAAFSLMLIAKADVAMMERLRAQITDSVAPIIDVMSRPVALAHEVIDQVHALVTAYEKNEALRQDKERLLHWQSVARLPQLAPLSVVRRTALQTVPLWPVAYYTLKPTPKNIHAKEYDPLGAQSVAA